MADGDLHAGHRERLRSRFLANGLAGFNEHELLELLLFTPLPRVNTNPIAHTLINKYGSIYAVLKAPPEELKLVKGIGDSSATFLNIVGSLVTLIMDRVMNNSPDFNERLNSFFTTAPEGDFILLFSDPSLGVVGSHRERVSHVINGSIAIRELLTDFLLTDARTVILGISHGPYLPLPTDEDYQLIECIREPLRYIEADIADVIIYGGGKTFSMNDRMPFSLK